MGLLIVDIVERKLKQHEILRDDDKKLLLSIWKDELSVIYGKKPADITWMEFRNAFSENKLSGFESIRRTRQKLQEHNPALRGQLYKERHQLETEVRKEIINYSNK